MEGRLLLANLELYKSLVAGLESPEIRAEDIYVEQEEHVWRRRRLS
jgi:hypothetical protein